MTGAMMIIIKIDGKTGTTRLKINGKLIMKRVQNFNKTLTKIGGIRFLECV